MTDSRILFDRVWKKFHRGQVHDSLRDLIPAVARRIVGRGDDDRELSDGDFWAVSDLSFEVVPGQCLGIIGPNGSGKSTTLKLLTRILQPSRGRALMDGRAGTLIEVSAGFHGDLTGRENVFLQGAIMGMSKADIVRKFDEIVEFSGVIDAIDTPVKRYSSGMNARLGFSIAAHLEPDILIIDEVLSVGDMSFQERAFGRIRELAKSGIPVVMVSHQLERIAELCTDAILLNQGSVGARGTPGEAIAAYVKQQDAKRATKNTGDVTFESVTMHSETVASGDRFEIQVRGRIEHEIPAHIEPLKVRVRSLVTGGMIFSSGSRWLGLDLSEPGDFNVTVALQANVPPGSYTVEIAAQDLNRNRDVASAPSVMIKVTSTAKFLGSVQLNPTLEVAS